MQGLPNRKVPGSVSTTVCPCNRPVQTASWGVTSDTAPGAPPSMLSRASQVHPPNSPVAIAPPPQSRPSLSTPSHHASAGIPPEQAGHFLASRRSSSPVYRHLPPPPPFTPGGWLRGAPPSLYWSPGGVQSTQLGRGDRSGYSAWLSSG